MTMIQDRLLCICIRAVQSVLSLAAFPAKAKGCGPCAVSFEGYTREGRR